MLFDVGLFSSYITFLSKCSLKKGSFRNAKIIKLMSLVKPAHGNGVTEAITAKSNRERRATEAQPLFMEVSH